MKVTTLSHPFVFESFRNIDFDNGAINYLEPALEEYSVPTRFDQLVSESEIELKALSPEQRKEFVTGCQDDEESVRLQALCPKADRLCNEFFEADGWRDGDVI